MSDITNYLSNLSIWESYISNNYSFKGSPPTSYTYDRELSRKIYTTIEKQKLGDKLIYQLIEKSRELKSALTSINFSTIDSTIYLLEVSDPTKLEASLNNKLKDELDYVAIHNISSSEEVVGKKLRPDEENIIRDGEYTFSVDIDGNIYERSLSIPGENISTNRDLLEILAYEINSQDWGLMASVEKTKKRSLNPKDPNSLVDYIYLKITNTNTGKNHYFVFQDIEGDLIKTLDLNKIDRGSQDSVYRFNSVKKTSSSNEVTEKSGTITLNFLDKTEKNISIKTKFLDRDITDYVLDIIDKFNNYIDWIYQKKETFSSKLIYDIKDIFSTHYKSLKDIDLHINKNDKVIPGPYFDLITKSNHEKVLNTLFGKDGFLKDIEDLLDDIIISPSNFQIKESQLSLYSRYGYIKKYKNNYYTPIEINKTV